MSLARAEKPIDLSFARCLSQSKGLGDGKVQIGRKAFVRVNWPNLEWIHLLLTCFFTECLLEFGKAEGQHVFCQRGHLQTGKS